MNPDSQKNDLSSDVATSLEEADRDVARSSGRHRHHPVVKTLGAASEIADQIPLSIGCTAIIGAGVMTIDPR